MPSLRQATTGLLALTSILVLMRSLSSMSGYNSRGLWRDSGTAAAPHSTQAEVGATHFEHTPYYTLVLTTYQVGDMLFHHRTYYTLLTAYQVLARMRRVAAAARQATPDASPPPPPPDGSPPPPEKEDECSAMKKLHGVVPHVTWGTLPEADQATTYDLPPTTYHLPPTTYHLSPITYCLSTSLPTTYCLSTSLPTTTTYFLPPTTYHLLAAAYYPLLITYRSRPSQATWSALGCDLRLEQAGRDQPPTKPQPEPVTETEALEQLTGLGDASAPPAAMAAPRNSTSSRGVPG